MNPVFLYWAIPPPWCLSGQFFLNFMNRSQKHEPAPDIVNNPILSHSPLYKSPERLQQQVYCPIESLLRSPSTGGMYLTFACGCWRVTHRPVCWRQRLIVPHAYSQPLLILASELHIRNSGIYFCLLSCQEGQSDFDQSWPSHYTVLVHYGQGDRWKWTQSIHLFSFYVCFRFLFATPEWKLVFGAAKLVSRRNQNLCQRSTHDVTKKGHLQTKSPQLCHFIER